MSSKERLAEIFKKFPTVGPRTAQRFVFYLMKLPKERTDELIFAISEIKNKIKFCSFCFYPYEQQNNTDKNLCYVCANPSRNKSLLCVVEKEIDLEAIEKTKMYKGLYFILGGTVALMRKQDVEFLRLEELKERVKRANFTEIIIAINPTQEGKATSALIERSLKELKESIGPASERKYKS